MNFETRSKLIHSNRTSLTLARYRLLLSTAAVLLMAGCSSGSLDSDVGSQSNTAPLPSPQILNGGSSNKFRTGSEVLLSGKNSEDPDGPILAWSWTQTGGPAVQLLEVNANTRSFRVPFVADGTIFTFSLEVTDSDGATASQSITVEAVKALDSDRYLSMQLIGESRSPRQFSVRARLAETIAAAEQPGYNLQVGAYLVYPMIGSSIDCRNVDRPPTDAEVAMGALAAPDSACLVTLQQSLTPAGGIGDTWPIAVDPAAQQGNWFNPSHGFRMPMLDIPSFNQRLFDAGRRNARMEIYNGPFSYTALRLEITPADVDKLAGVLVEVQDGSVTVFDEDFDPATGGSQVSWLQLDDIADAIGGIETEATADDYYDAVDPARTRLTLNRWLCRAGFGVAADCASLPEPAAEMSVLVNLRPEARTGTNTASERFSHATYLNNFDLGFGRDMYVRVDTVTGSVYAFVNNYATLENAARKRNVIVSVVMEYSPPELPDGSIDPTGEPFVKFFTYAPDNSGDMLRVTSMNFDARGELYTPGNCTSCHGGIDPGTTDLAGRPDVFATFLPWDPQSFYFVDTDPAINDTPPRLDGTTILQELTALESYPGEFSRANQMAQIKKLNEAALSTYIDQLNSNNIQIGTALDLLSMWYGGYDDVSRTLDGSFQADQVPVDWAVDPESSAFYLDVYAQQCRMCHTNLTYDLAADPDAEELRFATQADFAARLTAVRSTVYGTAVMPGARLTTDRLWSPHDGGVAPATAMSNYLSFLAPGVPAAPPSAFASVDPQTLTVDRNTTVLINGNNSRFAGHYSWNLSVPCDVLPLPFPGCTDSTVNLSGQSTATAAFIPDFPGDYLIDLTINAGTDNESTASAVVTVNNRPPNTVADGYSMMLTSSTTLDTSTETQTSVLQNDVDPEGDAVTAVRLSNPADGTLSFAANGQFVYTYSGNPISPASPSDSFTYQAIDEFGATSAVTTVTIALVGDETPPTIPQALSGADASTTGLGANFRVSLDWQDSSDGETSVVSYRIYRQPVGGAEVVLSTPNATSAFVDSGLVNDTVYNYAVAAVDAAGNVSARSGTIQVRSKISYQLAVNGIWANRGCTSCHSGDFASGSLPLDKTVTGNYNCLVNAGCVDSTGTQFPNQVNRTLPASTSALIVCKPGGTCPSHPATGVFGTTDADYARILRWVQQGGLLN